MKTYLDCLPCFLNQALRAGRMVTNNEMKLKRILDEVGMMVKDIPLENTPPETGDIIYRKIREISDESNPYKKIKQKNIKEALSLYPSLKETIEKSNDRLLTAIRFAIAGNVIDFGVNKKFDINQEIDEILRKKFAIFDFKKFKEFLAHSKEILYIGDNAGEAVFDRILIEEMKKPVTYVVRGVPVINDVTYEDAIQAGIDKVATIVSSGTSAPGLILKKCNPEIKSLFEKAEFIVSKGQGNYEGLSNERYPIFFLLKVKCWVIANDLGVNDGDIILKGNFKNKRRNKK